MKCCLKKIFSVLVFTCCAFSISHAEVPIFTDNRIKTYVYNENEVFVIMIHPGYQSSIEFAIGEEIETISVGNSYAWKLQPVGRRLFIKPLEDNVYTNMTIITNKRTYQFDVVSKIPEDDFEQDLAYVVRFYYPESSSKARQASTEENGLIQE